MSDLPVLRLKKDEDRRIRAGHLWIFSNEVDVAATPLTALEPGELVELRDARGGYLGTGYANPRSLIAARLLSRRAGERVGPDLLRRRIGEAAALRRRVLPGSYHRLVYGEGDFLPGLVVDRYGDTLVVQPTTAGIDRLLDVLLPILGDETGAGNILVRGDSPARRLEGLDLSVRTAAGTVPPAQEIEENGLRFVVPLLEGQKTGWFYDHRENRIRLRRYVADARVLDVFSYLGGWGIHAARFGAREVLCADSSASALEGVQRNAILNGCERRVRTVRGDAFELLQSLRASNERFDVVILDPPAFIKRKKDVKEGEQAYLRLNQLALELLPPGGVLVSASCSYHMSRDALLRAILRGAQRTGREIQLVEEGGLGPDHPVHPAIPETNYLKVFYIRVLG